MAAKLRWGIVGPGSIARCFAAGIAASGNAELRAAAGRRAASVEAFAADVGLEAKDAHADVAALLARDDVDAVYVAAPHPAHAQLSIDALRAGKHVLCEKPLGLHAAEVRAMVHVARASGRFFAEGFMYLHHPQIRRALEIIAAGTLGDIEHVEAAFCFDSDYNPDSRLYSTELAGGAVLDVGCYAASLACLVAGAAAGQRFAQPRRVAGVGTKAPSGADARCCALLQFDSGVTAFCKAAVRGENVRYGRVYGTKGTLVFDNPWNPGGGSKPPADTFIEVHAAEGGGREEIACPDDFQFAFEARAVSAAILDGAVEPPAPAMDWAGSIGNAEVLDAWRREMDYELPQEQLPGARALRGVIQTKHKMRMVEIEGVGRPLSQLVMGCDNQERVADGAVIWDAWMEAGGNAFDTAYVYGGGLMERLLGRWLKDRGVADEAVVVVKGAHTPHCDPESLRAQLRESLDRLQLDRAPIYVMHRDNPAVPVGEFIDCLDGLAAEGLLGACGASNWSLARFEEANAYAKANGKKEFAILNNNLSLARMTKPVWDGCVSSNDPAVLAYLAKAHKAHLSWSAQARGFFVDPALRGPLPAGTTPDECFGGEDNEERRRRAAELARELGTATHVVAAAWVLRQPFASVALIGPRQPSEIAAALPALAIELSEAQLAWLNLAGDKPA
ncbi:MAG: aldo/keto reductase [Betaproteobacteria bacterium AqS2]|uniref:Aldo/keto reductase n=1 Tax=Candidatus Amphirhobacter heronislandensis TaxID=1732024 RepID=A0A930Y2Z0_9GAMM|nr:aldo/keto reductase [Betaproteobacteria bacterium AqS2]